MSDLIDTTEMYLRTIYELVEEGVLEPVAVDGWRGVAYRHHAASAPRRVTGRALLCPFDPLIWERARTERIFGFRYRIEIYTPAAQRFICPCHGGVYDFEGKVDGGPPVRPLDRFYTRVRSGRVQVEFGRAPEDEDGRAGDGQAAAGDDDGDRRELLGRGLAPDDPQQRTLWLAHSGMFPCFLGGSVSRLLPSTRSALVTCTRVCDGGMTAST